MGKGWGVHPGRWPSDTGRQGKRADKGNLVEGEGKGGEPEQKPKAKGWAQWKPKSGHNTWVEQASESDMSGTSESRSQDKEDEKEKEHMPASKTRRTKQQAHRRKAYAMYQVPKVIHKGQNVPFAHRPCRKSPKEMRKNVAGMVEKWKNTYDNMKGLSQKVDQYLQQGPDLERLRGIVEFGTLGQFGMD